MKKSIFNFCAYCGKVSPCLNPSKELVEYLKEYDKYSDFALVEYVCPKCAKKEKPYD